MQNITTKIKEAAQYIKRMCPFDIKAGVILGSGLGEFTEMIMNQVVINYSQIPNFPTSTVEGHAGRLVIGMIGDTKVLAMQGRFHFYEGYKMDEVTFPVRVFNCLGIKTLVLTNAAGGVNTDFAPGDLMVIRDHINLSMGNPLIGKNLDEYGPRFPDMSQTYSIKLNSMLQNIYTRNNIDYKTGTYAYLTGPSYETPAEIRMIRAMGADAVGMSTVPESIIARHCGIEICGVSCITNMAAGILNKPLSHQEVISTSNLVKDKFQTIIKELLCEI